MNSNFLLLLILVTVTSCGVKGDPVFPKEETLPSLLKQYPDIKLEKPIDETKTR